MSLVDYADSGERSDGELFNVNPDRLLPIFFYLTTSGPTHLPQPKRPLFRPSQLPPRI